MHPYIIKVALRGVEFNPLDGHVAGGQGEDGLAGHIARLLGAPQQDRLQQGLL